MNALFDFRNDIKKDSAELYWSEVYMDVSNGNNRSLTLSPTWNHKLDQSEKYWPEIGFFLERAAEKLIASSSKVINPEIAPATTYTQEFLLLWRG